VQQHGVIAELGQHALAGTDLGADGRSRLARRQNPGGRVLQGLELFLRRRFALRVVWAGGRLVGHATVGALTNHAGYTLFNKPVLVEDSTETRFSIPAALRPRNN